MTCQVGINRYSTESRQKDGMGGSVILRLRYELFLAAQYLNAQIALRGREQRIDDYPCRLQVVNDEREGRKAIEFAKGSGISRI
jgi:hypothetical protein